MGNRSGDCLTSSAILSFNFLNMAIFEWDVLDDWVGSFFGFDSIDLRSESTCHNWNFLLAKSDVTRYYPLMTVASLLSAVQDI